MTADRKRRHKSLRLGVLALLPALVGQSGSLASAETIYEAMFLPTISAGTGSVAPELEPDGFGARWRGADRFVLTTTGEIVASDAPEPSRRIGPDSNQIGNDTNAIPLGSLGAVSGLNVHQIGNVRLESAQQQQPLSVGECGPSLLTPAKIRELVVVAARRHLVDEDLAVAVATVESDLDQVRNSPKGARGAMQLMPETAARFDVSDPCDAASNIDGGVRYLRVLLEEFQNPLLALAAYNAGEGRIYEYGGIPPFPETVGFVAKVINHQLDLPMPASAGHEKERGGSGPERVESGVITTRSAGEWVGGVMHFQTGAVQ